MRYFKEIDVSRFCYLNEAVAWVVQGIVPSFAPDDNGDEIRGSLKAALNDYSLSPDPLRPDELKHFGVELNYDEYLDALYPNLPVLEVVGSPLPIPTEIIEKWRAERDVADRKNKDIISRALFRYEHEVQRAKSKIVAALIQGHIEMTGYWFEENKFIYDMEIYPEAEKVPPQIISPASLDWDEHKMHTHPFNGRSTGAYHLITLETNAVLHLFTPPSGELLSARVFNGNATTEGTKEEEADIEAKPVRRPRGRPLKTDWLREGMRSWYQTQCRLGKLGTGKLEADLAAARAWAQNAGSPVSRTTVQNYLSDLVRGD